jgi:hypothetical protein
MSRNRPSRPGAARPAREAGEARLAAREAGFARRAMPNGQAPGKSIGGFRLNVPNGPFATPGAA